MKKVIILGGGFAGLTAAVYLANSGFQVEVIEASPKLGGRAYSFLDKETQTIIDNGQHIMMGCYKDTLKFLKIIGSSDKLAIQKNLSINFLKEDFNVYALRAANFPYPLNLLFGLLNYKAISFSDRLNLLKFFLKIRFYADSDLKQMSVHEWLEKENQRKETRKAFWDILAIGAMNTSTSKTSAKLFSVILKEIFFKGRNSAVIILPAKGLSEMYCLNAKKFIERNGGRICFSETAGEVLIENDRVVEIRTSQRKIKDFDYLISALPLHAAEKLFQEFPVDKKPDLEYSSILSVHIWLKKNNFEKTFFGLINSPVHWIFNSGSHLTIVISDADYLSEKSKKEIFELCADELKKYIKLERDLIHSYKVIKEKRATFIPSNVIEDSRPSSKTKIKNLFLAGDWTDTGLPSTIESAVKSGRLAAEMLAHNF